jgi:hypothetical protein
MVRQQLKLTNNIVVLSNVEALTVIAKAQSGTKKARAFRIGVGVVELGALASTWSGLGLAVKNTLMASALVGGQGLAVLQNTATAYAMVNYSAVALPETLNFSPVAACTPQGIQLIETVPGGTVDFVMPVPVVVQGKQQ